MTSVGRNSPCPCGSGRRYKECHGAINAEGTRDQTALPPPSQDTELAQLMREALALQQESKLAQAIAKYEAVIAREPGNFDALHMLGVAWFQSNQLDRAADYVDRALAIRPEVVAARSNRALIDEARRLAEMEAELCRLVLPKMSALARASPLEWPVGERQPLDLVIAARAVDDDDLHAIRRIVGNTRFSTVGWRTNLTSAAPELQTISNLHHIASDLAPVSDFMLVYGFDIPAVAWIRDPLPAHIALVVNTDLPCQLVDRLRELSDQGRTPIGIIFGRSALRATTGLPGPLLEEWLATNSLQ